jgi:hypothetical protein
VWTGASRSKRKVTIDGRGQYQQAGGPDAIAGTNQSRPDDDVEPAFAAPDAKQKAIDYACGRFGGRTGEVHVYGDDAATIERKIVIDGRGQYPQVGGD